MKQGDASNMPAWVAAEAARLAAVHTIATGPDGIVLLGSKGGGASKTTWCEAQDAYASIGAPAHERACFADAFLGELRQRRDYDLFAAQLHPDEGVARRVKDAWVRVDASGNETRLCSADEAYLLGLWHVAISARTYSVNPASGEWRSFIGTIDEASQAYPVEKDKAAFLVVCEPGAQKDVMLVARRANGLVVMGLRVSRATDGSALNFLPLGHDYQNRYFATVPTGGDAPAQVLRLPRI